MKALFNIDSLPFWTEEEILFREQFTSSLTLKFQNSMKELNSAWNFKRIEGSLLTPRSFVSESYDASDIFITQIQKANQDLVLRPETTASSYAYAKDLKSKLPICVYQLGKSFRVEKADGATASKLRFNEFYQLEYQFIYSLGTKADYRKTLMSVLIDHLNFSMPFNRSSRIIESDRLPEYSDSTLDIELQLADNSWKEVASCSIRNDYSSDTKVAEIAIGVDRLIVLAFNENK